MLVGFFFSFFTLSSIGQSRKLPDAELVARWFHADRTSTGYYAPYWASDFLILNANQHDLERIEGAFKVDSSAGFVYKAIQVENRTPVLLFGKAVTKLVKYYGSVHFKFVKEALARNQDALGDLLNYKYETSPDGELLRFDSIGNRLQPDSNAQYPASALYKLTFFLPDSLLKREDSFSLFTVLVIKGPSSIKRHALTFSKSDTSDSKPMTIHISSTPQHCEIFRIDQDVYDLDAEFKKYRSNNYLYDAAFLNYLTQYVVVEGATDIDIPTDETNKIIFIRMGDKLSPPLRCLPLKSQKININWIFR